MTPASRDFELKARVAAPLELALKRNVQAPAVARAAISGLCDDLQLDGTVRQTIVLLVSEVVSNAVLHSSGPADAEITVTATVTPGALRVAVIDAGDGFTPAARDPNRIDGGYGLFLLEKSASRWGVESTRPTTVWFEMPRGGQPPEPSNDG
jgi:anti-sigma regulatory factor (Ser/Thr protein kinase)